MSSPVSTNITWQPPQDVEKCGESAENTNELAEPKNHIIEVPDGGYGWVVLFGVSLFCVSTWASNSAYAIYLAHYIEKGLFPGVTILNFAAIGGVGFGTGLMFGNLILWLTHHTHVKIVIAIGSVFQLAGFLLAAFSTKLWQIYLTQGVLVGLGLAFIAVPSNALVSMWFRKKRAMAQALSVLGAGVGGIMFSLSLQAIIDNISLRWALIIQGIICTFCTWTGIILVKTRDSHVKPIFKVYDLEVMKTLPFLVMALYVAVTLLGYVILLYNLADFTISLGYSAKQGANVATMVSVGIIIGRPIVGRVGDIFGPVSTGIVVHFLCGLFSLAMWIPARNYATAIAFALIQGGLMGSIWVLLAPISARLFGLRKLAILLGTFYSIVGLIGVFSPIVGIKLRATPADGKYSPTQYRVPAIYCGVVYIASACLLFFIRCYLLARDQVIESDPNAHEDNDELHTKVSVAEIFGKVFSKSPKRKI
ncbi:hypothetical protein WICPIJ_002930 [Wickerhamomyces pijperi]|uniref:Major facilitator superfamily (MFS) profile domain-containing protein n=1 Tax=Wickerhamomyces pijperi TaxID=599730 RepID=A0A9P8Q887_WICPI|nr:hypothetical protein WICPIJ_002930 [Wickerhamomyces pijperi]